MPGRDGERRTVRVRGLPVRRSPGDRWRSRSSCRYGPSPETRPAPSWPSWASCTRSTPSPPSPTAWPWRRDSASASPTSGARCWRAGPTDLPNPTASSRPQTDPRVREALASHAGVAPVRRGRGRCPVRVRAGCPAWAGRSRPRCRPGRPWPASGSCARPSLSVAGLPRPGHHRRRGRSWPVPSGSAGRWNERSPPGKRDTRAMATRPRPTPSCRWTATASSPSGTARRRQMFGWRRAKRWGGSLGAVIPPEGPERQVRGRAAHQAGRGDRGPRLEMVARRRDGRVFPAEVTVWALEWRPLGLQRLRPGHQRAQADRGDWPGPGPGAGGVAAEVGVPGQHEPRDPDPDERRASA